MRRIPEARDLMNTRRDCVGILWHLQSEDLEVEFYRLLLADLCHKVKGLPPAEAFQWERFGYRRSLALPIDGRDLKVIQERKAPRILVLAVKPRELAGVLSAFGVRAGVDEPTHIARGYQYWEVTGARATYVVSMIGEERGVNARAAVATGVREFGPALCVLCGVAAGLGSSRLGDVVAAERVVDIEGGVVMVDGRRPRPEFIEVSEEIARGIAYLQVSAFGSAVEFKNALAALPNEELKPPSDLWVSRISVTGGTIVCGDELLLNPEVAKEFAESTDERAKAFDNESWAFARECVEQRKEWVIFRGVSDLATVDSIDGDELRGTVPRPQQVFAAMRAAVVATRFLETIYLPARAVAES